MIRYNQIQDFYRRIPDAEYYRIFPAKQQNIFIGRRSAKSPAKGGGMAFIYNTFMMSKREYAKIYGEINTNYHKYINIPFAVHASYGIDNCAYWYFFENHGYGDYNIYMRIAITED